MADALTCVKADDIEQAWIAHVTAAVTQEDTRRRRWLMDHIAIAVRGEKLTWKETRDV